MRRPFLDEPVERGDPFLGQIKAAARADKAKGTGPKVPKPSPSIDDTPSATPDLTSALHAAFTKVADHLQDHSGTATLGSISHAFRTVAHELKPPAGTGEPEPDTRGLLSTPAPEAM